VQGKAAGWPLNRGAAVIWTTEPPTKPGWYWHRESGEAVVVKVLSVGNDYRSDLIELDGDDGPYYVRPTGQWAGPLKPPE
jgi:hypothetical protein